MGLLLPKTGFAFNSPESASYADSSPVEVPFWEDSSQLPGFPLP